MLFRSGRYGDNVTTSMSEFSVAGDEVDSRVSESIDGRRNGELDVCGRSEVHGHHVSLQHDLVRTSTDHCVYRAAVAAARSERDGWCGGDGANDSCKHLHRQQDQTSSGQLISTPCVYEHDVETG